MKPTSGTLAATCFALLRHSSGQAQREDYMIVLSHQMGITFTAQPPCVVSIISRQTRSDKVFELYSADSTNTCFPYYSRCANSQCFCSPIISILNYIGNMKIIRIVLAILAIIPVAMIVDSMLHPSNSGADTLSELVYLTCGIPILIFNMWAWAHPEIIEFFFFGKDKEK